jgi:hypothetical protein
MLHYEENSKNKSTGSYSQEILTSFWGRSKNDDIQNQLSSVSRKFDLKSFTGERLVLLS